MSLSWPSKDPDEILDYDIDWTKRLYSATELAAYQALVDAGSSDAAALLAVPPADHISTSTFSLPAGITANSTANTITSTKVWISGGLEAQKYEILNEITTVGGRKMDQTVALKIKSK